MHESSDARPLDGCTTGPPVGGYPKRPGPALAVLQGRVGFLFFSTIFKSHFHAPKLGPQTRAHSGRGILKNCLWDSPRCEVTARPVPAWARPPVTSSVTSKVAYSFEIDTLAWGVGALWSPGQRELHGKKLSVEIKGSVVTFDVGRGAESESI